MQPKYIGYQQYYQSDVIPRGCVRLDVALVAAFAADCHSATHQTELLKQSAHITAVHAIRELGLRKLVDEAYRLGRQQSASHENNTDTPGVRTQRNPTLHTRAERIGRAALASLPIFRPGRTPLPEYDPSGTKNLQRYILKYPPPEILLDDPSQSYKSELFKRLSLEPIKVDFALSNNLPAQVALLLPNQLIVDNFWVPALINDVPYRLDAPLGAYKNYNLFPHSPSDTFERFQAALVEGNIRVHILQKDDLLVQVPELYWASKGAEEALWAGGELVLRPGVHVRVQVSGPAFLRFDELKQFCTDHHPSAPTTIAPSGGDNEAPDQEAFGATATRARHPKRTPYKQRIAEEALIELLQTGSINRNTPPKSLYNRFLKHTGTSETDISERSVVRAFKQLLHAIEENGSGK